jgi:hypothetical protein
MNLPNSKITNEIDDISDAVCEGRPLRPSKKYRVKIGDEKFNFEKYLISDPVPLSRQLLVRHHNNLRTQFVRCNNTQLTMAFHRFLEPLTDSPVDVCQGAGVVQSVRFVLLGV